MSKRVTHQWTKEEDARLLAAIEDGYGIEDFTVATGIAYAAAKYRFAMLRAKQNGSWRQFGPGRRQFGPGQPPVLPHLIANRDARRQAADRRTITQALLGDPPPGYSALDQRNGGV